MTIARDKETGRIIGQVVLNFTNTGRPLLAAAGPIRILGRDGFYRNVQRHTVRLEELR